MLRRGLFKKEMDPDASDYTSSMEEDIRIFKAVVQINAAHVQMLEKCEIIEKSEKNKIIRALSELYEKGVEALDLRPELEDIHMAVEEYVNKKAGKKVGGKLHTAKSRNDQVSTAIRMALREEVLELQEALIELINELVVLASKHKETIMPGYTHLQIAQPTTLAHYLNSYSQAFSRDLKRLNEDYGTINYCPLGACALAGTSFSIDRKLTSELLGFDEIVENTIDAVGSRDFALQTMSSLAIMMSNLSRLAQEIILWSSTEFDTIEVPDEFASTSSIMPQKKNPVVAEIARAKASRSIGELISGLNIVKSLPQSYSLDLQELTPSLWSAVDQSKTSLKVMKKFVGRIEAKPERMRELAKKGFSTATELADALAKWTEVPFRESHEIVGRMISQALENGKELEDLSLEDLQAASQDAIGKRVELSEKRFRESLDLKSCIESKGKLGEPAPESVKKELSKLEELTKKYKKILEKRKKILSEKSARLFESKENK